MGRKNTRRRGLNQCGLFVAGIGMAYVLAVLVMATNPLLVGDSVGRWFFINDLLYVYAVPMALCWLLAWMLAGRR